MLLIVLPMPSTLSVVGDGVGDGVGAGVGAGVSAGVGAWRGW